jgi:hypothetical protein
MKLTSTVLPESFLRCLDPVERKKLSGGQITWQEALSQGQVKNERQLQNQIVNLLRLKGIEPLWHRTDKKSAATIGWPDITFAVCLAPNNDKRYMVYDSVPCAWEVKFGKGSLSIAQQQMHVRLSTPPNAWRIRVIKSVDEALEELKKLGL